MPAVAMPELPLGHLRVTDKLFDHVNDGTCSRCRAKLGEGEVPLCLWLESNPELMYQFCQRCAFDPDSDRCEKCGCTQSIACDEGCGWVRPGLCSECVEVN